MWAVLRVGRGGHDQATHAHAPPRPPPAPARPPLARRGPSPAAASADDQLIEDKSFRIEQARGGYGGGLPRAVFRRLAARLRQWASLWHPPPTTTNLSLPYLLPFSFRSAPS